MAVDKLVDSAQLDTDLTSVANAIRAKSGGSGQLAFPAGFVSDIGSIPSGQTVYYTKYGKAYTKNMEIPVSAEGFAGAYDSATNLETVRVYGDTTFSQAVTGCFASCSSLTSAAIENYTKYGHFWFRNCTKLQTAQLGKIGAGVTNLTSLSFGLCTQSGLTITVYVDDSTAIPLANSPWGATNATIIYRSSTTGEVRTV